MEAGSVGVEGEAGSLLDSGAVAACWESVADADNRGQDEGRSCRRAEGAAPESAESHRGEEPKEGKGRTDGRSPLDRGYVVGKRTPLNWTEAVVDGKCGMLGLGVGGRASDEEEALEVELSTGNGRTSGGSGEPPDPSDPPPSAVPSLFVSDWTKDPAVVVLASPLSDLDVVLMVPEGDKLVNVGVVAMTPPPNVSGDGLKPPGRASAFVSEDEGGVEMKDSSVVAVVE